MKIIIEDSAKSNDDKQKVTIETDSDDYDIDDILQIIIDLLLAKGFHPRSIERGILGLAEIYKKESEK